MVFDWIWLIPAFILGLVVGLFVAGALAARRLAEAHADNNKLKEMALSVKGPAHARETNNKLLIPPPMIGDQTAAKWAMTHYAGRPTLGAGYADDPQYGVWFEITKKMYAAGAGDLGVFRHFQFKDLAALERKFTAMLFMLLDVGIREKTVAKLAEVHKDLDITPREYAVVINALYSILQEYKMPQNVLDTVAKAGAALKPVIVRSASVA